MTEEEAFTKEEWEVLLTRAEDLAKAGATKSAVSSDDKWAVGDAVAAMDDYLRRLREHAAGKDALLTPGENALRKQCASELQTFLDGQPVTLLTLRDYASVARQFPLGHPMRRSLTFSHARALRVLPTDALRQEWIARAETEKLAVGPLRDAINMWRAAQGEALKGAKGGSERGVYYCEATGKRITDISAMATLHLNRLPKPKPGFTLPDLPSKPGRHDPSSVLRFKNLASLGVWIANHGDTSDDSATPIIRSSKRRLKNAPSGGNMIGENMIGENMIGENMIGENMIDENMIGENIISENMIGENISQSPDAGVAPDED